MITGAYVLSAVGVTGATAAVTYAVGVAVVATVSVVALSAALDDKLKGLNQGGASRGLTNQIDPVGDFELVYGETRKGGLITYAEVSSDNKYLHRFLVLAGHEVDSIGDIYIQDEIVSFASGSEGYVTTGAGGTNWNQKVYIKKFKGSPTQNIYSDLQSLGGSFNKPTDISSAFKGQGIACLYIRMEYDADTFSAGMPLITAKVRGKKLYDPRKDSTSSAYQSSLGVSNHRTNNPSTWQYSDEPALAIRDYLTSGFGVGAEQTSIDDDMIATAVAACASTGASGVEENSFKINGAVTTGGTPQQNLNSFMTTLNGTLFYGQGKWRLLAGAYTSPDASVSGANAFGYDDIISDIGVSTRFSRRDTVNTVRGTFIDGSAGGRYIPTDYPEQQIPSLSEDNGQESVLDLTLPLTTNSATAQRIAKQVLFVGREQISISASFTLEKAFSVQVGDTIELTLDRYGWTQKQFKVMGWKMSGLDGSNPSVSLNLQETSSTVYQWSITQDEYQAITHNNTSLGDPTAGLAISNLTATATSALQTDGTVISRMLLSWTAVTNPLFKHYEVQWKPNSLSNYSTTTTPNAAIEIEGLTAGTAYNFSVKAVTVRDNSGTVATVNETAVTDTTAPDVPSAPTVTAGVKQLEVSWQGYSFPTDFASMNVYHSTTAGGTYSKIGSSAGTSLVHSGLTQNTTHYYKLLAKDFSGNPPTTTSQEIIAKQSPAGNGTVSADVVGPAGLSTFQATVYKRSSSTITQAPSGGTFNFGTNALTPPTGWSASIPTGTDPIYACNFQFQIQGDTGSETAGTWSTPYLYAENGADGQNGLSTFVASVFQRSSSVITQAPTGGSYNFSTNTLTVPSGWNDGVPSGSNPVYVSNATASVSGPTGTDSSLSWSTPVKFAEDGATGPTGQSGLIVTLNGAEIQTNNVDPQTTTQAQLDSAFLAANPTLAQMSDIPDDSIVWARFINPSFTNATSMVSGKRYVIEVLGTSDFTAVGATRNLVGIEFTSTGSTTGTGKVTTASTRQWDYNTQNWSSHAQTFDAPAIFSPSVFALETFSQFIAATEIVSDKLRVNSEVNLEDGAAWKVGKGSWDDETNGIFLGNPAGNLDFAFSTFGQNSSNADHGVSFSDIETRITNPVILKVAADTISSGNVVNTGPYVIKSASTNPNATSITLNAIGGGAGGAASTQTVAPTSGGRTRYRLIFNNSAQAYINASGGTADAGEGSDKWRGDDGQDSAFASGGEGGSSSSDPGDAGTLGSGGGGGAGRPPNWNTSSKKGGAGGGAGQHITNFFDISAYTTVVLQITEVGNRYNTSEGNGGVGDRGNGGDGGDGVVRYTIETDGPEPVRLDTQPEIEDQFSTSGEKFNHPSGFQVRYGSFSSTSDSPQSFTFTTAFSTTCLAIITDVSCITTNLSSTGFTADRDNDYSDTLIRYIAIGH